MTSSNQIHESLMRIKQSQANLLRQLRTQHDTLQGYLSSPDPHIYQYTQQYVPKDYPSFQSSLQLSKSQGNLPIYKNPIYKNSSTTNAQDILQNNYKKIQQLLLKQRKLYQQNHALQQQNQSLHDDYRTIKKLYYQCKQYQKQSITVLGFLLQNIVYTVNNDLIMQVQAEDITNKIRKNWNKFKIQHAKLFIASSAMQPFVTQSQHYINKLINLLSASCTSSNNSQKLHTSYQLQIGNLKTKIQNLTKLNIEIERNKQDMIKNQQKYIAQSQQQNIRLKQTIKNLQKQLSQKTHQLQTIPKNYQLQIIKLTQQLLSTKQHISAQQSQYKKLKLKLIKIQQQSEYITKNKQQLQKQSNILKQKLKQKQQIYNNQLQLCKRQTLLIQKLTFDLQNIRMQASTLPNKNNQLILKLQSDNQKLHRQLQITKQQHQRYCQTTSNQIISLRNHIKQIKNQHNMLLKSQQNARNNQLRYRELINIRNQKIRLSTNLEHLWAVKDVEIENLRKILENNKEGNI